MRSFNVGRSRAETGRPFILTYRSPRRRELDALNGLEWDFSAISGGIAESRLTLRADIRTWARVASLNG